MIESQIFKNDEFREVRATIVNGKPHFRGSGVAKTLRYSNLKKAATDHCEEDGVTTRPLTDSLGRRQETKSIAKGSVCRLVISISKQSKNKEVQIKAKKYVSWISDEIAPSVRTNGYYAMPGVHVPDFKDIPLEVLVSYQRTRRAVIRDLGKSSKEIATEFKKIPLQFGIELSGNFDQLVFEQESLF